MGRGFIMLLAVLISRSLILFLGDGAWKGLLSGVREFGGAKAIFH